MLGPAPLERYVEYQERVADPGISEFELQQIVRDLRADKKRWPSVPEIRDALGVALFRLGDTASGIRELRGAFHCDRRCYANLVLALTRLADFSGAIEVLKEADTSIQRVQRLPLFVLVSSSSPPSRDDLDEADFDTWTTVKDANILIPLQDVLNFLVVEKRIPICDMTISAEIEDGERVVDVAIAMPGKVEALAKMSIDLTAALCERFSPEILMQIVPRVEALEDGS